MPRLRENGNNVCIFFMKKKLSSYLVPIFFLLPTHFLTSNIGYGLKLELFNILVFLCTLKLLYQTHLEGKLSQVYYLSHEKKVIFLSTTKIFFCCPQHFFPTFLGNKIMSYIGHSSLTVPYTFLAIHQL